MKRPLRLLAFAAVFWLSSTAWAGGVSVTFINPGRADEPFWRSVTRFMEPAARQLDMQLEVLYAERDHTRMVELARQVTARARKPDYLIIVNEKLAGADMLRMADKAGIKTLVAFSSFEGDQVREFGTPRKQYKHWLGSITPNAYDAGRLTAADLVRQAVRMRSKPAGTKVHVVLLGGDKATPTGVQRFNGALNAMAGYPDVVIDQVLFAGWDRERARQQMKALLLRLPDVDAVWTASDLMAYGAIDAAVAAGRKPGRDILFATFNNSPDVLQARIDGRIASLAGGHFTAGAWALVMLYDYQNGKDFAPLGLQMRLPLFTLIDEQMAQRFAQRFHNEDFSSVDFRQYSRHLNPGMGRYSFGLQGLLKTDR